MKVYWSGAALALMADVTLRERSGGAETLDTVLKRFQACCLPSPDVWTGPEFFAKLDSLIDEPVFMPLYRRYADTAGFPDTSDVFERLGLRVRDDEVSIRRSAELADIRLAITRMDTQAAQSRGRLAASD
jgi:predicted metalloprotease with PDZ domain